MFVLFVAFHSHEAIESDSTMFVGEDEAELKNKAKNGFSTVCGSVLIGILENI